MKTELKLTALRLAVFLAFLACAYFPAGCVAPRAKDVALKGMYANGATETVAIGSAKITLLPEAIESFVAHYSEDTAWLSPSTKTHALDIYMTGTNSTASASNVVDAICRAFVDAKTSPDSQAALGGDAPATEQTEEAK